MATDTAAISNQDFGRLPFPLQDAERILAVNRRHWIFLWPRSILMLLIAIVPPIIISLVMDRTDTYDGIAAKIFWVVVAIWLIYWAVRIFLNWYRYNNDTWVITNQRIVDSYKAHPLNHRLSTADLVNIQDMTVERSGLFGTMLNFGDVVCETASAGGQREFRLAGIPHPQDVQLLVDRERDRERTRGR